MPENFTNWEEYKNLQAQKLNKSEAELTHRNLCPGQFIIKRLKTK